MKIIRFIVTILAYIFSFVGDIFYSIAYIVMHLPESYYIYKQIVKPNNLAPSSISTWYYKKGDSSNEFTWLETPKGSTPFNFIKAIIIRYLLNRNENQIDCFYNLIDVKDIKYYKADEC